MSIQSPPFRCVPKALFFSVKQLGSEAQFSPLVTSLEYVELYFHSPPHAIMTSTGTNSTLLQRASGLALSTKSVWFLNEGYLVIGFSFHFVLRTGIRHLLCSTAGRPPKRRRNFSPVDVAVVAMTWLPANVKWHALTITATVTYSKCSLFKFVFSPCCVHGSCVFMCVCVCEFQSMSHVEIRVFFQLVNFHADF